MENSIIKYVKNEFSIGPKLEITIKIILSISMPALTLILSNFNKSIPILLGVLLSFLIFLILVIEKIKIKKIKIKYILPIFFLSLYIIKLLLNFSDNTFYKLSCLFQNICNISISCTIISNLLGLMAIPIVMYFVYIFMDKIYPIIKQFIFNLTKVEKNI